MVPRFVIVTGMSGAGKSTTMKFLEDADYFCVDNLPVSLIDKFVRLTLDGDDSRITKVALGLDVRSRGSLAALPEVLDALKQEGIRMEILFLDCEDQILVKRFKESRRIHPLSGSDRIESGIEREREQIDFLKKRADYILDTSHLLTRELKWELDRIFVKNESFDNMVITILSFGFKYAIPSDADLVFDVRFLPNPYYVEDLKRLSGNDQEVRDYVMNSEAAGEFLAKLTDLVEFLVPNYVEEGKHQLVIAVGCTGGKHRSVTLANELFRHLNRRGDYTIRVEHRDIEKDAKRKRE